MRAATQILVIGGGPGGSTTAGLLAQQGFQVTLLERDRFPRYHIGESILPSCRPIFELLGVWDKVTSHGFQPKGGAYFLWGPEEWEVVFNDLGSDGTNAFQVIRSEFDELLLNHARELGVEVVEGTSVKELHFEDGRPVSATWAETKNADVTGRISFDYLVDASGRGGVMATKYLKSRRFHDVFRNVAAWSYWKNAKRLDRGSEGAIVVASVPDGWFWAIPLHDGTMSVGLVTGRDDFNRRRNELGSIEAVYRQSLDQCPGVLDLLSEAEKVSEMKVEQDYSYAAESFSGPGYLLVGDAACFLDPLLSTGVHLATYSAMLGAASIGSVLRGETTEAEAWGFFDTVYRQSYERMLVLVSVFYDSYKGKEHHFYNAQRLSTADHQELNIQAAFDRIITGIEDMNDAQSVYRKVHEHLTGSESGNPNPLANLNKVHEQKKAPMHAGNAVDGLYLSFRPQLGLARTSAATPSVQQA
ncbi:MULTISPECIES: NAD(P)/FAD-dependent oxidoreductase [Actinoalloteichus]|uniref:Flavin-dependent dehydrogenase n=1 Tax=Actinoalloteichus fjordicus TaxID=1612552 RepID=A0AAC9LCB2_9PSEU|nr:MULTISPECIES: NAD(P)/FAD-dependent oxidoreductase [Actinoalloteichus]APU14235.1 flavin-dependent dehydrogenase [Actinoalloteichus fjordicus]APU20204.1 flavin-dependent dehydrogenase [Actinoalloteichus sp. GBA129-24]